MSNEPTIQQIEMNMVICEFMGGYQWRHNVLFYVGPDGFEHESGEFLKYHSSWNWLMPVVEKIESIYDEFHGYFGVHISSNSCCIQGTKLDTRPGKEHYAYFNEVVLSNKKEATHIAVYQFIQWYNKQKEATNENTH